MRLWLVFMIIRMLSRSVKVGLSDSVEYEMREGGFWAAEGLLAGV
jgi:hypothetical protein